MALDNKLTKGFMALAKARNKFNLKLHKEMVAESKRLKRQQYEAAQGGNNGMWGMAASGAAIGTMFGNPVAGALIGGGIGAVTEAFQNKKTAEQYGKKGYGWGDAIGGLVRPPNLNESSQMAMAAAQMGAMKMNARPTAMPGAPSMASVPTTGGLRMGQQMPAPSITLQPGPIPEPGMLAPPYMPGSPYTGAQFDEFGNPLNPFDPNLTYYR